VMNWINITDKSNDKIWNEKLKEISNCDCVMFNI